MYLKSTELREVGWVENQNTQRNSFQSLNLEAGFSWPVSGHDLQAFYLQGRYPQTYMTYGNQDPIDHLKGMN